MEEKTSLQKACWELSSLLELVKNFAVHQEQPGGTLVKNSS